jgi:hypothetical protein
LRHVSVAEEDGVLVAASLNIILIESSSTCTYICLHPLAPTWTYIRILYSPHTSMRTVYVARTSGRSSAKVILRKPMASHWVVNMPLDTYSPANANADADVKDVNVNVDKDMDVD